MNGTSDTIIMASAGDTFLTFSDFPNGISMPTIQPLPQDSSIVVRCDAGGLEGMMDCQNSGKVATQKTGLIEEVSSKDLSSLNASDAPVLEVTITHSSNQHIHNNDDAMVAVFKNPSAESKIVFPQENTLKQNNKEDSVLLINDGENIIHLKKSVVEEYRKKTNYHGPMKAAVEKSKVIKDGVEREVVRTKLMQVKFVMKDSAGQELSGPDLDKAMAKIPGLIPACEADHLHRNANELVTISFGANDQLGIPKVAIEEYRSLAKVAEPLTAKRERLFKEEGGKSVAITVISLYPDRDSNLPAAPEDVIQENETAVKPRRGRPPGRGRGAGRGRPAGRGRRKLQAQPDNTMKKTIVTEKQTLQQQQQEESSVSDTEDCLANDLGFDGVVIVESPNNEATLTDLVSVRQSVDEEFLMPLQLQSTPEDMEAVLSSHQAWKYLTEYASQDEGVQGLVTQFNNESWLEVKRMSFFHVDGEAMTDISFKAVFRNNTSPINYYLRGFGRLIKSGELNSANDINHLFRLLSPDRKLCLGLKPLLFETEIDNNDQLRQYFKQKGQIIHSPFECLYSKACRGIVSVGGNHSCGTFSRGTKNIVGIQTLCGECVTLGKKMNHLIKGTTKNGHTSKTALPMEKITQERSNSQILNQPIKSKGPQLNTRDIRRIFSQNVSEILATQTPSLLRYNHDEMDVDEEVVEKFKRRKTQRKTEEAPEEEEFHRPVIGVGEEEFMKMIDIRPPNPGILARSIVKMCNVCQFRAPTMLALFVHMQGHLGSLKEKCGDCSVQLNSKEAMQVHKKQMHTQRSPMCSICQLDFTTKDQLFDHMNKHRNHLPFECPFCNHKLTNMDAYKKHVRLTHKIKSVKDLKLACRTCNIHFYTRDHLLLHRVNQNHEDIDPFVCKTCGYTSLTANEFRSHIWEHTEAERETANMTICLHCYKVFFSAFKLSYHLETKHLPQEKDNESVVKVEEEVSEPAKKKKNRGPYLRYLRANEKFECQKCRRRFKTHETLENHEKFSHGEKKVTKLDCQCSLCGRKFNALRRLANHMKIHSGNRPVFQCEECGQIYGKKSQVLEHIRTDHAEQVQQHQQQQELLQTMPQDGQGLVEISEQPHHTTTVESGTSASWSPLKSPFKVSTVEQTQEAVYSLLQLTDF